MARLARLALEHQLHLVLQRGHGGIFADDHDRAAYVEHLRSSAEGCGVLVHAYALLDDRVHLLATPRSADALSRTMQQVGRRYVPAFNRRHGRSGTLWEGRFRAAVVDPRQHLLDAMRYVEQAPTRAGLVGNAGDWAWSSAAHHLGRRRDPLVADASGFWALGNTPFERELAWRRLLEDALPDSLARRIADAQQKGWAFGPAPFLQELAALTDRPLAPRARGRPRKFDVSLIK